MPTANYSLHDAHLASATSAILLVPGAENLYGYATLAGTRENPEIEVHTFPDRESMVRALSELHNGRLLNARYPDVYRFGPDLPVRLYAVIEEDDLEDDEEAYS
ncbi:hypothetical protein [Microbacterium hominis]|uniref:hypothetical protein n=1 Tax=Microbacterium hominis TaxID=162426 RepID=UPI0007688A33|nr:hypothetical protein [Microbacterium hominis]KXC06425.1 hypothetical protein MhomT_05680 [Microbacterium hominis]